MRYYTTLFFLVLLNFTVFWGQESEIDKSDSIVLTNDNISIISSLTVGDETLYFYEIETLNSYFQLHLIEADEFLLKSKQSINYIINDTNKIKKRNGIIELVCEQTKRKFTDYIPDSNGNDDEAIQTFEYIGQIPFLNVYVVLGIYWEEYDYKFIDKKTGNEIASFFELPLISIDKKHLICIQANPYEMTADVSYYKLNKNQIQPIATMSFTNWMPADYSSQVFWNPDGSFYVGVNSIANFWNKEGDTNPPKQFIRFTLNN
jgi:hypothetical protein